MLADWANVSITERMIYSRGSAPYAGGRLSTPARVCILRPELDIAVSPLARFMPADNQREAAKRIIDVFEQWLRAAKDGNGAELHSADFGVQPVARARPDAEYGA